MLEPFNPVLLYKQQGVIKVEYPTLLKDSFILAIQTEFQMTLYRKFSDKILCIDATHGTNAYRFKLITCIVVDEFNHGNRYIWFAFETIVFLGQPIAWCISDQETAEVVELFLQSIKKRSTDSNVSVLMTDDG